MNRVLLIIPIIFLTETNMIGKMMKNMIMKSLKCTKNLKKSI